MGGYLVMTDSSVLSAFEEFYISKIEQGLPGFYNESGRLEYLTSDEKELLSCPVKNLTESGKYTLSAAEELTQKCIDALTVVYKEDTKGKNRKQARVWSKTSSGALQHYDERDPRNENELVLSKIVLKWWYPLGNSLQRKVFALFRKAEW